MVSMNMAARNHCSRPIARGLHGHNGCPETSPKALSRLNFQVEDSEKFGLKMLYIYNYRYSYEIIYKKERCGTAGTPPAHRRNTSFPSAQHLAPGLAHAAAALLDWPSRLTTLPHIALP